jgi:hypothetical protein
MGAENKSGLPGSLLMKVRDSSRWEEQDGLPGDQIWADFIEKVLEHLQDEGVFEELLPRLQGPARLRDGVLAEAYVSYYLSNLGFRVLRYEPEVVPGTSMDLEVEYMEGEAIFVEVKRPSWKGEVPEEEKSERNKLPKYLDGQGGSVDPSERIVYELKYKVSHKLSRDKPNIVAIVPDLFVSPLDVPRDVVVHRVQNGLSDANLKHVSGVLVLEPRWTTSGVVLSSMFINNPGVKPSCALPSEVKAVLDDTGVQEDDEGEEGSTSRIRAWWNTHFDVTRSFSYARENPVIVNNQTAFNVAIRLEENRVKIADWIAELSGVMIAIALPLLLTRLQDVGGATQTTFFVLCVVGALLLGAALFLGIYFHYGYMRTLNLNAHYLFKNKGEDKVPRQEFNTVIDEQKVFYNRTIRYGLGMQLIAFCSGTVVIIAATLLFGIAQLN